MVNIKAEISQLNQDIPVEVRQLRQDLEVEFSSVIIQAFSPSVRVEEKEDGSGYIIIITDKNGTTTAEIPIVTENAIGQIINNYFEQNPIIEQAIREHNQSDQAHADIRFLIDRAFNSIPTKISQLENDTHYATIEDFPQAAHNQAGLMSAQDKVKLDGIAAGAQVNVQSDWNATVGDAAILNKPTTLAGYGITDSLTAQQVQSAIDEAVASAFIYKGSVSTLAELPSTGNKQGDIYHVAEDGGEYIWNGEEWQSLGSIIDLSDYLQTVSIAGHTLTPANYTITADQLKADLGLGTAAYKNIIADVDSSSDKNGIPTVGALQDYVATTATLVEASNINGNIKVNNQEVVVYTLPNTTLDSSDILILDCGNAQSNYE